jgi:hypothetical protein
MGTIRVHEFMSLDGVIDAPTWTSPLPRRPADEMVADSKRDLRQRSALPRLRGGRFITPCRPAPRMAASQGGARIRLARSPTWSET